jgi:hypothetical protein
MRLPTQVPAVRRVSSRPAVRARASAGLSAAAVPPCQAGFDQCDEHDDGSLVPACCGQADDGTPMTCGVVHSKGKRFRCCVQGH